MESETKNEFATTGSDLEPSDDHGYVPLDVGDLNCEDEKIDAASEPASSVESESVTISILSVAALDTGNELKPSDAKDTKSTADSSNESKTFFEVDVNLRNPDVDPITKTGAEQGLKNSVFQESEFEVGKQLTSSACTERSADRSKEIDSIVNKDEAVRADPRMECDNIEVIGEHEFSGPSKVVSTDNINYGTLKSAAHVLILESPDNSIEIRTTALSPDLTVKSSAISKLASVTSDAEESVLNNGSLVSGQPSNISGNDSGPQAVASNPGDHSEAETKSADEPDSRPEASDVTAEHARLEKPISPRLHSGSMLAECSAFYEAATTLVSDDVDEARVNNPAGDTIETNLPAESSIVDEAASDLCIVDGAHFKNPAGDIEVHLPSGSSGVDEASVMDVVDDACVINPTGDTTEAPVESSVVDEASVTDVVDDAHVINRAAEAVIASDLGIVIDAFVSNPAADAHLSAEVSVVNVVMASEDSVVPKASDDLNIRKTSVVDDASTAMNQTGECGSIVNSTSVKPADSVHCEKLSESKSCDVSIAKLSLNQLKKYYKWCNLGLSPSEALSKCKEPGLVPQTEDPHPDCKLPFEEIKAISLLLPAQRPKAKFIVETFFGGKDVDEQLRLGFSASNTERHRDCKHNWEDLKKMAAGLTESKKMQLVVEAFYGGKEPADILKTRLLHRPSSSLQACEHSAESSSESVSELEISKLSLNHLKRYYIWCTSGLSPGEALAKAKELGPVPRAKDPHPDCRLPFEEIKNIASLVPNKDVSSRFFVETYFGGKDVEEQLKLSFSACSVSRHPDCKYSWEDLKKMSAGLLKESLKMKFIVDGFYGGKEPELKPRDTAGVDGSSSHDEKVEDDPELEIAKLNVSELKKYYKWRILGCTTSKALSKAKEPGLLPETEGPHPNCKLNMDEITQISFLIPQEDCLRVKFIVEIYFGGKDPEEQLKLALSNCGRHPAVNLTWEDLRGMCAELPKFADKMKFIVNAFYGGKDPKDLLRTLLPVSERNDSADQEKLNAFGSMPEPSVISKLRLNQLKKYYKWCNLGVSPTEALTRAQTPGLIPQTDEPHPNCKLTYAELKAISALIPSNYWKSKFIIESQFGGKNHEEQFELALSESKAERHPGCKHSWEDLKKMSSVLKKESLRLRFVVESFYGGKSPAALLKGLFANKVPPSEEVHFVDGTVKKAVPNTEAGTSLIDPYEDPTVIEPGPISRISNNHLKYLYLHLEIEQNFNVAFSKAGTYLVFPPREKPHRSCRFSKEELENKSQALFCDKDSSERFFIHTYFGGKDPECTLKFLSSRVSTAAEKPEGHVESVKKQISAVEKLDLPLALLQGYFLWLIKGCTSEMALYNVNAGNAVPGVHYPHPKCKHFMDELLKLSEELGCHEHERSSFFIFTYYGGFDPDITLYYFKSRCRSYPLPKGEALRTLAEEIAALHFMRSPQLRYYYLWRNMGSDHATAVLLSEKKHIDGRTKRSDFSPHPDCKHTERQLRRLSKQLLDPALIDRFVIHTFYGGRNPEDTLEYMTYLQKSRKKRVQFEPVAKRTRSNPTSGLLSLDNPNHPYKKLTLFQLKNYYLWVNRGLSREEAMIRAKTPGLIPHSLPSRCLVPMGALRSMSLQLPKGETRELFITETYYGGNDPHELMEYLLAKSGTDKQQPNTVSSGTSLTSSVNLPPPPPDGLKMSLDDPNHPSKELSQMNQLKRYYYWVGRGCSRDEAMIKAKTIELHPGALNIPSRCSVSKKTLKKMSQKLPPGKMRELFIIETYHAGHDPDGLMSYLLSKSGADPPQKSVSADTSQPMGAGPPQKSVGADTSQPMGAGPPQKSVGAGTSQPMGADPPQKSVGAGASQATNLQPPASSGTPSQTLDSSQAESPLRGLKNYYLWMNHGCSSREALIKANTSGLVPEMKPSASCSVPMEDLHNMSKKLPTELLRDRFIVETYCAGNDPLEVMERLLPSACTGDSSGDSATVRDSDDIEDGPIKELTVGELKYYYLWRNAGLDHMSALENVINRVKFSGPHHPHPNSGYTFGTISIANAELKRKAEPLPLKYRGRYVSHILFGGKDPESTLKYFYSKSSLAPSSRANPSNAMVPTSNNPSVGLGTHHPAPHSFPALPLQLGHAGLPTNQHPPNFGSTPSMVPYQETAHSSVNSYGQVVPGPLNVAYPPNQPRLPTPTISCEPVMYSGQPQAVAGSSRVYPPTHPQVPPHWIPTVPPPMIQPTLTKPPPPLAISISKSLTTQPTKPSKPVPATLNSNPSALKRKAADEFPIKIKLKCQAPELPQSEDSRGMSIVETPPQSDGSVPSFIVPTSYPKESLSDSQMDAIESCLLEAILEMDDDGTKPSFKDASRSSGRYCITCVDQFSVSWLRKFLSMYKPWPGASLKVVSTKIKANAVLPPCKAEDDKKILKFIERQNKGLNVGAWTVVQRWDNGDFNTCMDLVIDEESAEILRKCSTISFKLGSADIIVAKKDTPLTSGGKKSSGEVPSSSNQDSLPPPPKFVRTGEGFPSIPKGHEKVRDSSPQRSSACRSPSQDRFGRPISRSRSPSNESEEAEDQSWKDWFYSKDKPGRSRSRSSSIHRSSRRTPSCDGSDDSRSPILRHRRRSPSWDGSDDSRSPIPRHRRRSSHGRSKREHDYSSSPSVGRRSRRSPSFDRHERMRGVSRSPLARHRSSRRTRDSRSPSPSYRSSYRRRADSRERRSKYH